MQPGNETQPFRGVALPVWGGFAFAEIKWNPQLESSVGYSMLTIQNSDLQAADAFSKGQYGLINFRYYPVAKIMLGAEYQFGRRDNFNDGFHSVGNKIFGIKFKVSPIIFEKKINFSEYAAYIFPLAYLIDRDIIKKVKEASSFAKRMEILSNYYENLINKYSGSLKQVDIVTEIIKTSYDNNFKETVDELAVKYGISTRTLQRYFEAATSITSKQALQIMRIRKATSAYVQSPNTFDPVTYGYFDYSHFYKHINQFLQNHKLAHIQSYLQLLQGSGIINY